MLNSKDTMRMKRIMKCKKGQFGTWYDLTLWTLVGIVIFIVFFSLISTNTKKIEKEIKEYTNGIKSDVILVSCLNMPLFDIPGITGKAVQTPQTPGEKKIPLEFFQDNEIDVLPALQNSPSPLDTSASESYSKVTMADLLNFIEMEKDKSRKDQYIAIFRERMTVALDKIYGQGKWKVHVKFDDLEFDFGTFSGPAHTSGVILPSFKGGLIGVYLLTEGTGGVFDELLKAVTSVVAPPKAVGGGGGAAGAGIGSLTIVIDPGHGGRDPGTVASGAYCPPYDSSNDVIKTNPGCERNKNMLIADALASKLTKAGAAVYLTREGERFNCASCETGKAARTEYAASRNANLFISIHNNNAGGPRMILLPLDPTCESAGATDICAESKRIADAVQSELEKTTGKNYRSVKDGYRGSKTTPLGVFNYDALTAAKNANMKVFLIEVASIEDPDLNDPAKINAIADAIIKGITNAAGAQAQPKTGAGAGTGVAGTTPAAGTAG